MLRERKQQMAVDALDATLTSAPDGFYGVFHLTNPDRRWAVWGGLLASLSIKLVLVMIRRPKIWAKAKNAEDAQDRNVLLWW